MSGSICAFAVLEGDDLRILRHQSRLMLVSPLLLMVAGPDLACLSKHPRERLLAATLAPTDWVPDLPGGVNV